MEFHLDMSVQDFVNANSSYYQQRFEEDSEGFGVNVKNPDNYALREQEHQEEILDDFEEAKTNTICKTNKI